MKDHDVMNVTILEDGRIKSETDGVSGPNHSSAEAFLRTLGRLAGGTVTRQARGHKKHKHQHQERTRQKIAK